MPSVLEGSWFKWMPIGQSSGSSRGCELLIIDLVMSVSNFGLNPQFKREGKKSQTRTPENLSTIPHKNNDTPFSRISDKS